MRLEASDLFYLAPELTLVIFAVVLAVIDLLLPRRVSRTALGIITLAGLVVSAAFVLYFMADLRQLDGPIELINHTYRVDDFANLFKLLTLAGTAIVIVLSLGDLNRQGIQHAGEYYYLYLPAAVGAMIMASSGDLITLYVGLELLSITTYIMAALRKAHAPSPAAGFKYMVNGSIASALILYGMSFLYGMTGTTQIGEIRTALVMLDPSFTALTYISFFLMLAGLGFKVAAAPFHTWAADVYQGAPTPVTAYLAVVSKAAGFAMIFRVMFNVFYNIQGPDAPIYRDAMIAIMVVAALSMIVGTALALKERNMKRLLAYSGIANAGYLLVPVGVGMGGMHMSNFTEMFFYLIAYLFMNLGAFAVLTAVSRTCGHEEMSGFAGLYYRAPWTAFATVLLVLSLAGLPVSGGFIGKFYIMLGAVSGKEYWLAAIMIVTSVASFYFYFSVIRQMFMRQDHDHSGLRLGAPAGIIVWICAAASFLMGLLPKWVFQWIESVFTLMGDLFVM